MTVPYGFIELYCDGVVERGAIKIRPNNCRLSTTEVRSAVTVEHDYPVTYLELGHFLTS